MNDQKKPPSKRWHFIAAFLADYRLSRAMLIGTAIYGLLVWFDLPAFVCPWKELTSLPCPGCGMTRSTLALMKGDFAASLQYNALTWLLLLFWTIIAIGITIPARYRNVWISKIGEWEQRSRWGLWFVAFIAIYTLTRWFDFL